MARAVAGEDPRGLALPVSDPQVFPYHGLLTRTAPPYLAWLRRKDLKELDP
jgi:hypothetical protein